MRCPVCGSSDKALAATPAPLDVDVRGADNLRNLLDSPPPYRGDNIDWMTAKEAHSLGWTEAITKVREYLAATPAPLDVERLARALNNVRPYGGNPNEWAKVAAAAIAAAYAEETK